MKNKSNVSSETKELINKIHKKGKEVLSSKEKSKEFLVKIGVYTKKGNLRKSYR